MSSWMICFFSLFGHVWMQPWPGRPPVLGSFPVPPSKYALYFLVIPIFPCDSATLHRILEGWNVYLVLGISLNFMFFPPAKQRTILVFFNGAIIALRCANTCLSYCYSLFAIRMVHVTNVD